MRRFWIRTGLAAGGVAGGLFVLVVLFIVFANTESGWRSVAQLVSSLSGGTVTVQGLSGRFPDSLRITHLDLRDDNGVWLSADKAALDWSPLALLRGEVKISRLDAQRLVLGRMPQDNGGGNGGFPHIDIESLDIPDIEIGAAVAGGPARLQARGSVQFDSLRDAQADLSITRLDKPATYRIDASIRNGFASGTARVDEGPEGLLAEQLDLPNIGPIALTAHASGPARANALTFTLQAGALQASGQGTLDLPHRRADIDFSAEAPAMQPAPDLSWQSLTASGHLHGTFDAPNVTMHLDIRDLAAGETKLAGVTADVNDVPGGIDFTAAGTGAQLPGFAPDTFSMRRLPSKAIWI